MANLFPPSSFQFHGGFNVNTPSSRRKRLASLNSEGNFLVKTEEEELVSCKLETPSSSSSSSGESPRYSYSMAGLNLGTPREVGVRKSKSRVDLSGLTGLGVIKQEYQSPVANTSSVVQSPVAKTSSVIQGPVANTSYVNQNPAVTTSTTLLSPAPSVFQESTMPTGLPDRFFTSTDVPFKILSWKMKDQVGNVMFLDEESVKEKRVLWNKLQEYDLALKRKPLAVNPQHIQEGGLYVVKDYDEECYRRALVKRDNVTEDLIDADTFDVFSPDFAMGVFQMDKELEKIHLQVVECRFSIYESKRITKWKEQNKFMLGNKHVLDIAVLAALGEFGKDKIDKMKARKIESRNGIPVLHVDLLQDEVLKEYFLKCLTFFLIPRIPAVQCDKIALITNVKENGEVDVTFYQIYDEIQDAISKWQIENKFFKERQAPSTREIMKEIHGTGCPQRVFLAPYMNDWNELFRVRVIEEKVDSVTGKTDFKVKYIDTGKEAWMSNDEFYKVASSDALPEGFDILPPQAVSLRIHQLPKKHVSGLIRFKTILEKHLCYINIKSVSQTSSEPPEVELYAIYMIEMFHIVDLAKLGCSSESIIDGSGWETSPEEKKAERERKERVKQYNASMLVDIIGRKRHLKMHTRKSELKAAVDAWLNNQ